MEHFYNLINYHLNLVKTNFIYFKNTNVHDIINCNIEIDGLSLFEKQVKFLGVTIDSHLNFNEHIRDMHTSVSRNIGILYNFSKILSERPMIVFYTSLILSHVLYCNIVWDNSSLTRFNSLFLLQKRAIRMITNSNYIYHAWNIYFIV